MSAPDPTPPAHILAALADLAPDSAPHVDTMIKDIVRLPFATVGMFSGGFGGISEMRDREIANPARRRIERFVKRARLHDQEDLLRAGWLWVTGHDDEGDEVRFPLVTMRLRPWPRLMERVFTEGVPVRTNEPELTDLITDPATRSRLESTITYGGGVEDHEGNDHLDARLLARLPRLQSWALDAAKAAGYPAAGLVERATRDTPGINVVAQVALYLGQSRSTSATVASTLRSWAGAGLEETAFGAVYRATPDVEHGDEPVSSSVVLSPAQRDVVRVSRTAPITVVSGPPGTGKTQTVAAVALDAIERGESVLVAAPGSAAVEALITLLTNTPGPDPVVFGAAEERREVADRLGQGGGRIVDKRGVADADQRFRRAAGEHRNATASIEALLRAELAARSPVQVLGHHARTIAPRWFDPDADLGAVQRSIDDAERTRGWFVEFRRNRKLRRLAADAGGGSTDLAELRAALDDARANQAMAELERMGGLALTDAWPQLEHADDELRRRKGEWLNALAHSADRVSGSRRSTMAAVAAALRSGRAKRREKLGRLDGRAVAEALPLWIGTLRDIDDLLPRTSAMFDLVIIDEGSQVDQIAAAPALLRASRAVVVGDPKQLRHVSFLSDERVEAALAGQRIDAAATRNRLDVRRLSLFDLAAASAPTRFLDEHFRSAPHLIGFSARRFYDGSLAVATTHPRNDRLDCIHVHFLDGRRGDNGVNQTEIDAVLDHLRRWRSAARAGDTTGTIGVVSPYRNQVDAIERAVVEEFSLDEIDLLGLRVGTVHGFQGCERDTVLISLAVDADSPASSRSFLGDANLFNVMITRARRDVHVLTSLGVDAGGIVGDYVRYGDAGPSGPQADPTADRWARELSTELARSDIETTVGYRAGRHVVDLVLGNGDDALGLIVGVHPDGPAEHIERHLTLRRAGWDLLDVFDSKWRDRRSDLAVELALEARHRTPT